MFFQHKIETDDEVQKRPRKTFPRGYLRPCKGCHISLQKMGEDQRAEHKARICPKRCLGVGSCVLSGCANCVVVQSPPSLAEVLSNSTSTNQQQQQISQIPPTQIQQQQQPLFSGTPIDQLNILTQAQEAQLPPSNQVYIPFGIPHQQANQQTQQLQQVQQTPSLFSPPPLHPTTPATQNQLIRNSQLQSLSHHLQNQFPTSPSLSSTTNNNNANSLIREDVNKRNGIVGNNQNQNFQSVGINQFTEALSPMVQLLTNCSRDRVEIELIELYQRLISDSKNSS